MRAALLLLCVALLAGCDGWRDYDWLQEGTPSDDCSYFSSGVYPGKPCWP